MNDLEFLEYYKKELVEKEIKIFTLKGSEYSGESNRFNNFEKLAEELNLHPIEILWVYLSKHKDGVASFVKDKKVRSNEDVIGRINDVRNYFALLAGMIEKYRNLPANHKWKLEPFWEIKI